MKHSDSTEMERLLRRFARRDGGALRAGGSAIDEAASAESRADSSHMDADELNAYAEGALPEGSRSRYFAHLADCDTCRKLVTSLTLAATHEGEERARVESLLATPGKSWREWLAAIFSPPVLRYGVPALALFAVIVVALVAVRTRKENLSVAQNAEESRYAAPANLNDSSPTAQTATGTAENHTSSSNVAPSAEQQSQTQPGIVAATPADKTGRGEDNSPVVSQERPAEADVAKTTDSKDGSINFGAGKREQTTVAADAPAASPPPPAPQPTVPSATTATESRDRTEEEKKQKVATKDDSDELSVNGRAAGGTTIMNKPKAEVSANETASRPAAAQARRSVAAAKNGPPAGTMRDKEDSAETRSVGGRRFERRGGAWVDTAYNSSRAVTNVARGSEQYRALVADEHGLRSIAEQLGGEVIVVWKGRTYRFH